MGGREMKRIAATLILAALALVSSGRAQSLPAMLRGAGQDRAILVIEQAGTFYVPADVVTEALGGTLQGDRAGYRITFGETIAGFTLESRFGAAGDELIEMPAPPISVDDRPFVPWTFFRDLLRLVSDRDLRWDPATRILEVGEFTLDAVSVQISVVELEAITKILLQFPRQIEHSIRREPTAFVIETRPPLRTDRPDQSFGSPLLDRITARDRQIVIQLPSAEVAGDPYILEDPFRIVIDLQQRRESVDPVMPALRRRDRPGLRTIVLDPGHGGKEVGAIGPGGLVEKDATLAICRRLQSLLSSSLGARVILTRNDDSLVPLDQRTAIANQYQADLFLSVHLNAARAGQAQARGAETYYLSLEASDELARAAADRENQVDPAAQSLGADSSSDLRLILWDLAQQEYLKESSRLAELVQSEMNGASGVVNRGVKQAPFRVLIGATMPAALVEVGFISNPAEEARLASAEYQDTIAQALLRAVRRYKEEYETRLGAGAPSTGLRGAAIGAAAPGGPSGR